MKGFPKIQMRKGDTTTMREQESKPIFATDLDGTCIFSNRELEDTHDFIEVDASGSYRGYMHKNLYEHLKDWNKEIWFVPVTTRSKAQYERIRLPITPHLALAANGAVLYVDGVEDVTWYQDIRQQVGPYIHMLQELSNHPCAKLIEGIFIACHFDALKEADAYVCEQLAHIDKTHFHIHQKGRKVFVIPHLLEKGEAVKRLARRYAIPYIYGAGDSVMDTSLLEASNRVIEIRQLKEKGDYRE